MGYARLPPGWGLLILVSLEGQTSKPTENLNTQCSHVQPSPNIVQQLLKEPLNTGIVIRSKSLENFAMGYSSVLSNEKNPQGGWWELHVCCAMTIDADGKVMPRDH